MLEPRRLLTFREVARRASFSRAAEALALTQPAVSQQIAALEREVGAPLLDRGPGGLTLTETGELLLGHADALASRLDAADAQLAELRVDGGQPSGERVGVREKQLAGRGEAQAAGPAVQQQRADLALQRRHLLRDRGLGERERLGRAGERRATRDLAEREESPRVQHKVSLS